MEIIIKLEKEDILTNPIGTNFKIQTEKGITIIFSDDAINELILDYNNYKSAVK